MIELGKKQTLQVVKTVDFGVYLAEDMNADTKHQVLLPAKQVPAGTKAGDKLEVFIYKDSQDRMIATTNEPRLTVGEAGLLRVKQVTKIGAFLDWGLRRIFCFHIMSRQQESLSDRNAWLLFMWTRAADFVQQ